MKTGLRIFRSAAVALISAVMAIGFNSCSKVLDERGSTINNNGNIIEFSAEVLVPEGVATRGNTYDASDFSSFYVYAYNADYAENDGWFMYGVEIESSGSEWVAADGGSYTFPAGDSESYFYAVSAQNPNDVSFAESGVSVDKDGSNLKVNYSMPEVLDNQPSLLIANKFIADGTKAVSFEFNIALSALLFCDNTDVYSVESLEIEGLWSGLSFNYSTSAYTCKDYLSDAKVYYQIDDNILNHPVTFGLYTPQTKDISFGDITISDGDNNTYLMLPAQSIADATVKANLEYHVSETDLDLSTGESTEIEPDFTAKILTFSAGTSLLRGYYYSVNIDDALEPEPVWNCYEINLTDNTSVDTDIISALESGYNCLKFSGVYDNSEFPYASTSNMIDVNYEEYETGPLRMSFENVTNIPQFNTHKFDIPQLEEFVFPNENNGDVKLVTSCFEGCVMLKTLVNCSSVTDFNSYNFKGCTALESVVFDEVDNDNCINPDNVFEGCTSLKSVSLAKIPEIDNNLFSGCSSLESVNIPIATEVKTFAFENCSSLEVLELPSVWLFEAIVSTGTSENYGRQFTGCTALKELWLTTDLEIKGSNSVNKSYDNLVNYSVFEGFPSSQCTLYLNAINYDKANGNSWGGVEWKSIMLVD